MFVNTRTFAEQKQTGRMPDGNISAEPFPCNQTTVLVENADPIFLLSECEQANFCLARSYQKFVREDALSCKVPARNGEP